ncbi:MAG: cytochrome P450 [Thermoanaerobaculia bacterium]
MSQTSTPPEAASSATVAGAAPPGPSLGPYAQLWRWLMHPVELLEECSRVHGDCFALRFPDSPPVVVVSSPNDVQRVFRAPPGQLLSGNQSVQILVGENSLLMLDGPAHTQHRQILQPTLHGPNLEQYLETIREVTLRVLASWPVGRVFALHPEMQRITLEVILRTIFGLSDPAEIHSMGDRLTRFLSLMGKPIMRFPLFRLNLGPLTSWGRAMRLEAEINRQLYRQIEETRRDGSAGRADVLARLIRASDASGTPFSDLELRDEMMTLLVAGQETTAIALAWTVHRLLAHPEVHQQVIAEHRRVLGSGRVTLEKLRELPYTMAVIDETLRLNPVFPLVVRWVAQPLELSRHEIPAGWFVAPCTYLAHRRPESFAEPLAFRPERFLAGRPDTSQYFPFGGGSHICIGPSFANFEMKTVLAEMLSRFSLEPGNRGEIKIVRRGFTFVPSNGLPVRVGRRPEA